MAISLFVNFNIFNRFLRAIEWVLLWILLLAFCLLNFNTVAIAEIVVDSGAKNHSASPVKSADANAKAIPGIVMDYPVIIDNNTDYHIYRSRQWAETEKHGENHPHKKPHAGGGVVFYSNNSINNNGIPTYTVTPTQKNILRARYYANKK